MWTIFCLYWICHHIASVLCLGRGLETLWRVKKRVNSVQSLSRVSLWPHGLQHARLPFPSPTPGACSNSHPLSRWCHATISSSVTPFSSCLQSFPASGSFPMTQFFTAGGQSIGVSASASVLLVNIQDWFPLGWIVWSPCSPRDSQESSLTPQSESRQENLKLSSLLSFLLFSWVFPGDASNKEPDCHCRRNKWCRFSPWVGKIPRRREWQSTPVFLPGKFHE